MGKPRLFTTVPVNALLDPELTLLDLRVIAWVAWHDGMSLVKGKGAGCYASNRTIAALVGCDYTSLSRSLSKLAKQGHIVSERSADDRRLKVLRVCYPEPDSWPERKLPAAEIVGEPDNDPPEIVGEQAGKNRQIVGEGNFETRRNLPKTDTQYIPLNGGIDPVETEELNSSEEAHLAARMLPERSKDLSLEAELSRFERTLKREPWSLDLASWIEWLGEAADQHGDDNRISNWAQRLMCDAEAALDHRRWETGQADEQQAAEIDQEQLRTYALQLIRVSARGTQSRLASAAGIAEPKLSTFLRHRVELPPASAARLARELNAWRAAA